MVLHRPRASLAARKGSVATVRAGMARGWFEVGFGRGQPPANVRVTEIRKLRAGETTE